MAAEGEVSLALILPLAWLAAALGDLASFWLGKRLGRRFLLAHGPRLGVTAARLERVEGFFERHGPKAILAGRFIGIVRAVAPFLAGASGMRLRAFVPWSLLGTAVWATTFTLIGYGFSHSFGAAADTLTHGALALAVLAAAALAWHHHRKQQAGRRASGRVCVAARGPSRAGRAPAPAPPRAPTAAPGRPPRPAASSPGARRAPGPPR